MIGLIHYKKSATKLWSFSIRINIDPVHFNYKKNTKLLLVNSNCTIHIDGLVQERRNSTANTLELHLSSTDLSLFSLNICIAIFLMNCWTIPKNWINKISVVPVVWGLFSNMTLTAGKPCLEPLEMCKQTTATSSLGTPSQYKDCLSRYRDCHFKYWWDSERKT